jgi:hypothetical protein
MGSGLAASDGCRPLTTSHAKAGPSALPRQKLPGLRRHLPAGTATASMTAIDFICVFMVTDVARRLLEGSAGRAMRARRPGGRMGIAAAAVAELAGTPPPRAASNAAAGDHPNAQTPSFQDHIDANDQTPPTEHNERARAPADARPQQQAQSHVQMQVQTPTAQHREAKLAHELSGAHEPQADADTEPAQPTPLLQLIATPALQAPAPAAAVKADAASPQQQGATASPAAPGATPAVTQPVATHAAATLPAAAAMPIAAAAPDTSNTNANARPTPSKTAKGAAAKSAAAAAAAPNTAATTPPPAAIPPQQSTTAPAVALAPVMKANAPKTAVNAKSDAIEGVNAATARAPQQFRQAQLTPSRMNAPEAPPQVNAGDAKPADEGKAQPRADAFKQAAADLAPPPAPKTQASAPLTAPPSTTHLQLAAQAAQADAQAATDARTQAGPVAAQIGGEIIRRFNGQDTTFQLRLDPPDLGRVDVRLDVSRDHRVTAVISADNPQALSDLARGARDLQQALQSAGLDLSDEGLRFNLSSNGQGNAFAQAQSQQEHSGFGAGALAQTQPAIAPEIAASRPLSIDSWRGSRVDLLA